jgi:8-oxo-dGTP pyrophosphatase MutT (NUDIX family)
VDCIVEEAHEEASLDEDLVKERLRSVGCLTYVALRKSPNRGETDLISPTMLYVYDLELPENTIPKPNDDEVEQFYLMNVDEIIQAMKSGEFKTNSAMVMIDFFIRHGIICPENEPDYVEIIYQMHRQLPVAITPMANLERRV